MKKPDFMEKLRIEGMKSQIRATVMHSAHSKKKMLSTYFDEFMNEKNVKKIKMPEFLDWVEDKIPEDTTYNIVKGKIVFKVLPPFGTIAKEPSVFEDDSIFEL